MNRQSSSNAWRTSQHMQANIPAQQTRQHMQGGQASTCKADKPALASHSPKHGGQASACKDYCLLVVGTVFVPSTPSRRSLGNKGLCVGASAGACRTAGSGRARVITRNIHNIIIWPRPFLVVPINVTKWYAHWPANSVMPCPNIHPPAPIDSHRNIIAGVDVLMKFKLLTWLYRPANFCTRRVCRRIDRQCDSTPALTPVTIQLILKLPEVRHARRG